MLKPLFETRRACKWPEHVWVPKQYLAMYQPLPDQPAVHAVQLVKECWKCGRITLEPMVDEPNGTR